MLLWNRWVHLLLLPLIIIITLTSEAYSSIQSSIHSQNTSFHKNDQNDHRNLLDKITGRYTNPFEYHEYRWVTYKDKSILKKAVGGGFGHRSELYVCRTNYDGGTNPGKVTKDKCFFTYKGRELADSNFEILIGNRLKWGTYDDKTIPTSIVIGGSNKNRTFYICRTYFRGTRQIGKITNGKCYFGYHGLAYANKNYQILTTN